MNAVLQLLPMPGLWADVAAKAAEEKSGLFRFLQTPVVWVIGLALAAFLVLFWAMRGAPIGQDVEGEGDEAPRGGYRDRVIAALVLGLMLVCAGAYVASAHGVLWSLPVFGSGFGIVLTLVAINRRYRHASPVLRRTIELSNTLLNASLIAGVLIVINAMAFRYGGRAIDLTRERMFSLSSLTVAEVKNLAKPVKFTVFYGQSPLARAEMARVMELLDLYKALDPSKVKIEQIDPYRDREQFELLVKRIPDVQVSETGGVVIEYGQGEGAQHLVVPNHDLFAFPRSGRFDEQNIEKFKSSFKGEDAITYALMRLREEKRPKFVFLTGHGQPALTDLDPRKEGLGLLRSRFTATGADVSEVNLVHEDIPRDADIVIAIGGRTPFHEDEVAKLGRYLAGGKPVLAIIGNPGPSGLEDVLGTYNITVEKGLIVDPKHCFGSRPNLVAVQVSGESNDPLTRSLANETLMFVNAAPLKVVTPQSGKPNPQFMALPILSTSRDAWAETDLTNRRAAYDAGKDQKGPFHVGVAVSARGNPDQGEPEQKPRLVVLSSSAMVDNIFLNIDPANLELVGNAVTWLRGQPDLGIGPKTHEDLRLTADPLLRTRLVFVPTVTAMIAIVMLGLLTYNARRD